MTPLNNTTRKETPAVIKYVAAIGAAGALAFLAAPTATADTTTTPGVGSINTVVADIGTGVQSVTDGLLGTATTGIEGVTSALTGTLGTTLTTLDTVQDQITSQLGTAIPGGTALSGLGAAFGPIESAVIGAFGGTDTDTTP